MAEALIVPAGFRFRPTDEEVIPYLRDEWMTTDSLRLGFIHDIDLYAVEPWKLWEWFSDDDVIDDGDDDQEEGNGVQDYLYFFSPLKKKTQNGTRVDRTVVVKGEEGSSSVLVGTWKFQTAPVDIIDSTTGMPVGVKKDATFVPQTKMVMEDNEHDSSGCSSKKRKKQAALEEMQGISYIMHEYTLCPYENQIYSLCRIRRKIDKIMMNTNKKMRISNTTTTSTSTCCSEVVQPADQKEVVSAHGEVQVSSEYNQGSAINAIEEYLLADLDEEFMSGSLIDELISSLQQEIAPAATTGGSLDGGKLLY